MTTNLQRVPNVSRIVSTRHKHVDVIATVGTSILREIDISRWRKLQNCIYSIDAYDGV